MKRIAVVCAFVFLSCVVACTGPKLSGPDGEELKGVVPVNVAAADKSKDVVKLHVLARADDYFPLSYEQKRKDFLSVRINDYREPGGATLLVPKKSDLHEGIWNKLKTGGKHEMIFTGKIIQRSPRLVLTPIEMHYLN